MTIPEKFIEMYEKELPTAKVNRDAFNIACDKWVSNYGFNPPYSSFESFKVVFHRVFNKKS